MKNVIKFVVIAFINFTNEGRSDPVAKHCQILAPTIEQNKAQLMIYIQ